MRKLLLNTSVGMLVFDLLFSPTAVTGGFPPINAVKETLLPGCKLPGYFTKSLKRRMTIVAPGYCHHSILFGPGMVNGALLKRMG